MKPILLALIYLATIGSVISQSKAIYVMDFLESTSPRYERIDNSFDVFMSTDYNNEFVEDLFNQIGDAEHNDILISIHGMWGSDRSNFKRTANQLNEAYLFHEDSVIDQMIYIKWPCNDYVYKDNRSTTADVAPHVKQYFFKLMKTLQIIKALANPGVKIHLLCHSLGNYLLEELMHNTTENDFQFALIDELILAAADLPTYVFEKNYPMRQVKDLAERITVYYNRSDLTLKISEELNDIKRLGRSGLSPLSTTIDNIYTVDGTDINDERDFSDKLTSHSYHRNSPMMEADIRAVLSGIDMSQIGSRVQDAESQNAFIMQINETSDL